MSAVRRLLPVIASRPRPLIETLICNIVVQLGTLGLAAGLALLIGRTLAGDPADIYVAGALLAAAAVVTALATWRESMASHDLAYGLIGILRDRIFTALRRSLPDRRRRRHSGDLTSTALADVETLEWLYAHTVAQTLTAALVLAITVTVSVLITPWLLLIWVPLLVAGVATPWLTSRVARRQAAALAVDGVTLRSDMIDTVHGLRELRAANALDRRRRQIAARTASMTRMQAKVASRLGLERGIADALLALAALGSLAVAALTHDTLAPELVPLAFTVSTAALAPAAQISDLLRNAGTLRESAHRIVEILDRPPATRDAPPSDEPFPDLGTGLEFRDVSFTYDERTTTLDRVSFTIRPGETVALVGPSGAGKTTCARLALRLWDPDDGTILVAGHDATTLPDTRLRELVSAVPQDAPVLTGTIESNLRLGAPTASAHILEDAAKQAGIVSPDAGLPRGLASDVGERGAALSGGQRARVAIARALVNRPAILILDEATAALDPEADAAISAFLRRPSTRATLVIAHRPATIAACDRTIQLRDGRIVLDDHTM
ncbi:ABC transporter ATP-binding protein [Jiangella aurantiaca]|uniref:ABC transporter ATP-binding protein n=1 Tax=Jiangella aurantiaca TaxID=2530373 RepID=A0A4R5AB80_9ACTN|nr:ABC transporter ATP-binding protein [Jiangella aurantiaca]TDD68074.1 ABC transporter ATP-binding protein [Jiangella aurantiaca]